MRSAALYLCVAGIVALLFAPASVQAAAVDDVKLIQGAFCAGATGHSWRIRNNNKSQTVQITLEKQGAPNEVIVLQPAEEKGILGCYYKVAAVGGKYL
ncbi:hypothetical protein FHT39_000324 [Mitsuaria sp. BK045]|uniref:hypothetical protein n=1 Tax=unclassified Roseateles TaxID=2626991 RepID=UPI00160F6010|nr:MULTISPECIES: hypothetical protein [unclassified Roseateles]MBB3291685.1 hypothetical protein [Mitsuaria sp. BK041]MBB3360902.1 hypothetical protein [Mitsuaria sp. BK045]